MGPFLWAFPMQPHRRKKPKLFTVRLSPRPQAPFYYILKSLPHIRKTTLLQAVLPPPNSMPKISGVIHEINEPLLSPSVLVRVALAHAKRRLFPIQVTGICKSWAVYVLHGFSSRAPGNFLQLFVGIVTTVCSFYFSHALKGITWKKSFFLMQHRVSSTTTVPTIDTH